MNFEDSGWEQLYDRACEAAYIEACELVSPNAPEFDELVERLTEKYLGEL